MTDLDAHIARIVADAPPLTDKQRDRLARLLWPESTSVRRAPSGPTADELARAQAEREHLAHLTRLSEIPLLCRVCDLPRGAHHWQKLSGMGFHDWQPMSSEQVAEALQAPEK